MKRWMQLICRWWAKQVAFNKRMNECSRGLKKVHWSGAWWSRGNERSLRQSVVLFSWREREELRESRQYDAGWLAGRKLRPSGTQWVRCGHTALITTSEPLIWWSRSNAKRLRIVSRCLELKWISDLREAALVGCTTGQGDWRPTTGQHESTSSCN